MFHPKILAKIEVHSPLPKLNLKLTFTSTVTKGCVLELASQLMVKLFDGPYSYIGLIALIFLSFGLS